MRLTKEKIRDELLAILKGNAPVREEGKYPTEYGGSPYPGNLKNNGIRYGDNKNVVEIGGAPAPYALYTETRSRKKYWMKNSYNQFIQKLNRWGGRTL